MNTTANNVATSSDIDALESLLAGIESEESSETVTEPVTAAPADEIIEPVDAMAEIDALLDAAQSTLEQREVYEAQDTPADESQPDADKPTVIEDEVETEAPKRKVKGAKAPKAAKAPKEAKPPKEPKPKVERVTFVGNSKSKVLDNRLGGKSAEFLVLENADATLDPTALAIKQQMLMDDLDTKIAKKVAEKAIMLMKDLAAGGRIGNEVMRRAFEVLARDGYLSSGDKGNLQINLDQKYSKGTSRSQANQMFSLFPFLKIAIKDAKGHMVPNADSTILASVAAAHDLTIQTA